MLTYCLAALLLSVPTHMTSASQVQGQEVAKLFIADGKALDLFGREVAVCDDRLVTTSSEMADRGAAYVFVRSSTGWVLEQKLTAFDGKKKDFFGWGVAFDGSTLMVGAHQKDTVFGNNSGKVYSYVRTPAGWVLQETLLPSQGTPGGEFGNDVDMDGDTLIVGAPHEASDGVSLRGAAYVFVRRDGSWVEQAKLVGEHVSFLVFGADVAIRGNRAFASTPTASRVYVFERSGVTWSRTGVLEPPKPAPGYGEEIDFDGQTLWVGATFDSFAASNVGAVYSYTQQEGNWTLEQRILPATPFASQFFGHQVQVEGDWGVVSQIVPPSGFNKGFVRILHRENGVWSEVGAFCASDDYLGLDFGSSLGLDGATVVSGAMRGENGVTPLGPTGAAYIHVLDLPPAVHCTTKLHSEGCAATIDGVGSASLTDPASFDVGASDVVTEQNGLFFYGLTGPYERPFEGGTLCVAPPLRRTPIQTSGGQAGVPCDGSFTFDVNAWLQAGNEPSALPGVRIDGQYWFRDPGAPAHVGLTDAIRFFVNP